MRVIVSVVVLSLLVAVTLACNGACQHTSVQCPGNYVAGQCPGPADIQCCQEPTPSCAGQCQDNSLPCSGSYAAGMCPGPSNVQCCKSGGGGGCRGFADSQWSCTSPSCSGHVPSGSGQPGYQCAEFVSRSLAAAGYIGLSPTAPQGAYGSHAYGGRTYDLLWVSSKQGGPLGLEDFLRARGWHNVGANPNAVTECSAVMTYGSHGAYSHTVVGISAGTVDAHNNARYHASAGMYNINAVYQPPGSLGVNVTEPIDTTTEEHNLDDLESRAAFRRKYSDTTGSN